MLHAIDQNKAGRNFSDSEIHWKELFTKSEDSLTSSVLGSLLYLPNELFWSILQNSIDNNILPKGSHPITSVDFWPSWDASETRNSVRIEPDVFIRTETFDLVIEVKQGANWHSYEQWKDQCQAYCNEFGDANKPLFYLALGGLVPTANKSVSIGQRLVPIMTCKWYTVLDHVKRSYDTLNSLQHVLYSIEGVQRILKDVVLAFSIHGYFAIQWLATLPAVPYRGIKDSSLTLFEQSSFAAHEIHAEY